MEYVLFFAFYVLLYFFSGYIPVMLEHLPTFFKVFSLALDLLYGSIRAIK